MGTIESVVTFDGPKVPENVSMYNGLANIPVRLYVEAVIQCFQYYGFGHWKDKCKKERTCEICGEDFHDRCEKRERCVNCKGEHRANDRKCEVYRKQEEINKTMAKEGVTGYVARRREEEVRRNGKENKSGLEKRKERKVYREEKGLEEAKGSSWADIVSRKGQRQEESREEERKRRGERDKEDGDEGVRKGNRRVEREGEERRGISVEEGIDTDYDNLVKRVDEKVVRYIRKRFLEMEQ